MSSKPNPSPNPKDSDSVVVHDISDCLKAGLLRGILTEIVKSLSPAIQFAIPLYPRGWRDGGWMAG